MSTDPVKAQEFASEVVSNLDSSTGRTKNSVIETRNEHCMAVHAIMESAVNEFSSRSYDMILRNLEWVNTESTVSRGRGEYGDPRGKIDIGFYDADENRIGVIDIVSEDYENDLSTFEQLSLDLRKIENQNSQRTGLSHDMVAESEVQKVNSNPEWYGPRAKSQDRGSIYVSTENPEVLDSEPYKTLEQHLFGGLDLDEWRVAPGSDGDVREYVL